MSTQGLNHALNLVRCEECETPIFGEDEPAVYAAGVAFCSSECVGAYNEQQAMIAEEWERWMYETWDDTGFDDPYEGDDEYDDDDDRWAEGWATKGTG